MRTAERCGIQKCEGLLGARKREGKGVKQRLEIVAIVDSRARELGSTRSRCRHSGPGTGLNARASEGAW